MNIVFLLSSVLKIVGVLGYVYFLLWVLGSKHLWVKIGGVLLAFGVVQLALTPIAGVQIFNDFDRGLLFQAGALHRRQDPSRFQERKTHPQKLRQFECRP